MNVSKAFGILCGFVLLPGFAGDLEDGIKFHERNNFVKAFASFQAAAANGDREALRRLGFMYYHGESVPQDNRRAVALFEKAAVAGDIQSASNLGKMYEFGMGVAQDEKRAAMWHLRGAELGDADSQFNISVMYYKGQGIPQDRIEAAKWWTLAMLKGGIYAERIRPSVESAEGKLTQAEIAEGRRRAAEWARANESRK